MTEQPTYMADPDDMDHSIRMSKYFIKKLFLGTPVDPKIVDQAIHKDSCLVSLETPLTTIFVGQTRPMKDLITIRNKKDRMIFDFVYIYEDDKE